MRIQINRIVCQSQLECDISQWVQAQKCIASERKPEFHTKNQILQLRERKILCTVRNTGHELS